MTALYPLLVVDNLGSFKDRSGSLYISQVGAAWHSHDYKTGVLGAGR